MRPYTGRDMVDWVDVPVGIDADRWTTRPGCRIVVVLVHSVTCGNRLLDVVDLLGSDLRVQVVFAAAPSAFPAGVAEFLSGLGAVVLPWEQVVRSRFDLAVAAGTGGLERVHAPVVRLPHGVGFGKRPVAAATGGPRAPRQTYGLGRQWLVRDGRVVASAVVLAHEEERRRLAAACPEAVDTALVAGDPVVDRLAASAASRSRYRDALGVDAGQRLVVVSSTWGRSSLLGSRADVLWRLVREARGTRWRVALVAHPNVWAGHGVWQVRSWLADLVADGLRVVHPFGEWRSALVASDVVLGDHGSVSLYAAAAGRPVAVATTGRTDVDPEAPMAELLRLAPEVSRSGRVVDLVDELADSWRPRLLTRVRSRITSAPGEFAPRLRRRLYQLLDLPEPAGAARLGPVDVPTLLEGARGGWWR